MHQFLVGWIFNASYKLKENIARIAFIALGVVFEMTSKICPEMREEIKDWEEGRGIAMGVLQHGPSFTVEKRGTVMKYLGLGIHNNPDVLIQFKCMDAAMLVFTGLMAAHTAAVQRRTIVSGNIGKSAQAVRAINIVQAYLMPGVVVNMNYKRPPRFTLAQRLRKLRIYLLLVPAIIANSSK